MGPFYCPLDQQIYLDLQFFEELSTRFGAPGDFAQAYVIAHEVGHHVQQLARHRRKNAARTGRKRETAPKPTAYSVALELQADCYAGVWASRAEAVSGGAVALEPGDLEEGLRAASAVGDDTLQQQSQGRVVPDSFTHGSAEQRREWLLRGYRSQNAQACDTFGSRALTPALCGCLHKAVQFRNRERGNRCGRSRVSQLCCSWACINGALAQSAFDNPGSAAAEAMTKAGWKMESRRWRCTRPARPSARRRFPVSTR